MDPMLLAHAMRIQRAAKGLPFGDSQLRVTFSALDMLDYLGKQIDAEKEREAKEATRP